MLQRIQTIYLLAVSVIALTVYFIDYSVVFAEKSPQQVVTLSVVSFNKGSVEVAQPGSYPALIVLNSMLLLFSVYALLKFSNRIHQIMLCRISVLVSLLLLGGMFLYTDVVKQRIEGAHISYMYGIIGPIVQAVLLIMAIGAIRKDENLVRSADRLR